jgi:hypothetical protein
MPVRVVESNTPAQVSGTDPGNRSPLPPSSLLGAGQAFSGTQNVSNQQKEEAWRVNVQIQGIDLEHGYLCGTMEALNVPMADTPVSPYTLTHFFFILLPLEFLIGDTILDSVSVRS